MQSRAALLVDDDIEHRDLMARLLLERGYRVKTYANPISFMLRCDINCHPSSGHCFDVIVAGNKMSGMSGIDFIQRIRSRGCYLPDHQIGIFCCDWDDDSLQQINQLGCRFFSKPIVVAEVDAWISAIYSKKM